MAKKSLIFSLVILVLSAHPALATAAEYIELSPVTSEPIGEPASAPIGEPASAPIGEPASAPIGESQPGLPLVSQIGSKTVNEKPCEVASVEARQERWSEALNPIALQERLRKCPSPLKETESTRAQNFFSDPISEVSR